MNFANVYNQIMILFLLMVWGYVFTKLKLITREAVDSFTTFIINIAMPALIIGGMMIPKTPEKLKASGMILLISICVYAVTFIMAKIVAKLLRVDNSKRGVYEFALMFSNVGFMGFPVIESIFGKEAIFFTAIYNIPFNILLYTIGISMVSVSDKKSRINIKAFINSGVIASIIGFAIFLLPVTVPKPIEGVVNLVGSITTPMSMIIIGSMLASLSIKNMFGNWKVYVVSIVRVLIWPLLMYIVFRFIFNIQETMFIGVPVIIAGMPVAANAAMMVQEYGNEPEVASQCIFMTTLASVLTIPLISMLFF